MIFDVTVAMSLQKLVAHIDEPFDLFLLDVSMPENDGFTVAKYIKDSKQHRSTPLVFLSSFTEFSKVDVGFRCGATDYIDKQVPQSHLVARLVNHAQAGRYIRQLEADVITDPLTGLLNRHGFHQRMTMLWGFSVRNKSSVLILAIDMNSLKLINDTFGHSVGDCFIESFAGILKAQCQRSSDIIARMGRDEFMVVFSDFDAQFIDAKIAHIQQQISQITLPLEPDDVCPDLSASIGYEYLIPSAHTAIDHVLHSADKKMYAQKHQFKEAQQR